MHKSRPVCDTGDPQQLGTDGESGEFDGFSGNDRADFVVFNDKLHTPQATQAT
jgi:hypothetical protein